jgi:hypothetical protein
MKRVLSAALDCAITVAAIVIATPVAVFLTVLACDVFVHLVKWGYQAAVWVIS